MQVSTKVLAAAIVGALFAGNAVAANLSAPDGAIPAYFAKEIIATDAAPTQLGTSAAGATLDWDIGYNFSDGEVRHARVECSDNIAFDPGTTVTSTGVANIGSINGLGSNVLTFSVTSAAPNVQAADTFTVAGNHDITGTDAPVTCSVALYDQPSQAQAGGTIGRIQNTYFSGSYLAFVRSYGFTAQAFTAIADVEAAPAFSDFVPGSSPLTTLDQGHLSNWTFGLVDPDGAAGAQGTTFDVNGMQFAAMDQLLSTGSSIVVDGDFSLVASAGADPYNAAARARVSGPWTTTVLTATRAAMDLIGLGFARFAGSPFHVVRNPGNIIQTSDYVASFDAVSADPAVYAVSDISSVDVGHIDRNGTELQAPLVQRPNGWLSRMVLTNTGGQARNYTVQVIGETGNVIGTANLTGVVPANGTTVVNINDMLTSFSGSARATLVVNVAGPNGQIQGLYQIVNADSGSISNHVMVRLGTN